MLLSAVGVLKALQLVKVQILAKEAMNVDVRPLSPHMVGLPMTRAGPMPGRSRAGGVLPTLSLRHRLVSGSWLKMVIA